MAYQKVAGVVFADGSDRSDALNAAGRRHGLPPIILVAGAFMESGLGYRRERWGQWPDISFGDWQQTVAYAPYGDHTASDANIAAVRDKFLNDWDYSLEVAARQYAAYWKIYGDALETFSRYNGGPRMPFARNPNRRHIQASWDTVQSYQTGEDNVADEGPQDWAPLDVRDQFPYVNGREYPTRELSAITKAIYHHGAARTTQDDQEDEMAALLEYWELHTGPKRGWPTIAYHMAIGRSGRAYWLNGLDLIGYHAGDWPANVSGVGIVFIGDFEHAAPPPDMLQTAIRARLWVAGQVSQADLPYFGHKDYTSTNCPGEWWPSQRGLLATLEEPWTPPDDGGPAPGGETLEDLVNFKGWATGDLADGLQGDADHIRELAAQSADQDIVEAVDAGLQPRINTLRRGGASE
jgi:hypothetical protein